MNHSSDIPSPGAPGTPFLSLSGVGKTYPGVVALEGLSMDIMPGEVIGLVGENGAGKSTLMKILGGVIAPDRGTILLDGAELHFLTVESSISSGIAFVHQELNLFENLDVAANIFLGREPLKAGPLKLVDRDRLRDMSNSAGHGIGTALKERISQQADVYSFLFKELGVDMSRMD